MYAAAPAKAVLPSKLQVSMTMPSLEKVSMPPPPELQELSTNLQKRQYSAYRIRLRVVSHAIGRKRLIFTVTWEYAYMCFVNQHAQSTSLELTPQSETSKNRPLPRNVWSPRHSLTQ